ncbi:hypothetical protein [Chondromyces apiculatus]|uniref:Uncharacterized protein n=1 Tax=Chondromyces apiculatus DSM 436 TaxID=1192034 RepID=A0A017T712_9BACT|nr:hypothetical protein [Chondromyces apiculatus]EYF05028.1 Hypothetical protein CAP_3618 [Chondromyces apiculatus DSM 436]
MMRSSVETGENDLDFDCDYRFGFNVDPRGQGTVGYLLFWSGCGGLNLKKDIEVWNPFNAAGQTVVTGRTIPCIGLLESMRFSGDENAPMRFVAYVSQDSAADIRSKISRPLTSTKLQLAFYVIAYDDEKKQWYEAAFVKDKKTMDATLDTTGGEIQIFISKSPTPLSDTLDIKVYRFEFQVVPAKGKTATLEFALGPTQRIVQQWTWDDDA